MQIPSDYAIFIQIVWDTLSESCEIVLTYDASYDML